MSHIVTIQTKLRDPTAIAAACQRLGLPAPVAGVAELYGGQVAGLLVQLPDWQYSVVINVATGDTKYDNYNGAWGDRVHLDRLIQGYAVEKTKIEARRRGCQVCEQTLADGSIQVQITEGA